MPSATNPHMKLPMVLAITISRGRDPAADEHDPGGFSGDGGYAVEEPAKEQQDIDRGPGLEKDEARCTEEADGGDVLGVETAKEPAEGNGQEDIGELGCAAQEAFLQARQSKFLPNAGQHEAKAGQEDKAPEMGQHPGTEHDPSVSGVDRGRA